MHLRALALVAALLLAAWAWRPIGVAGAASFAPPSRVITAAALRPPAQSLGPTETSRGHKEGWLAGLPSLRAGQVAGRFAPTP